MSVEIKHVAGAVMLMLLAAGLTYQLKDTGNILQCRNEGGWIMQDDGKYRCGDRTSYCSQVKDTMTGKKNYYCHEAVAVAVTAKTSKEICDAKRCTPL